MKHLRVRRGFRVTFALAGTATIVLGLLATPAVGQDKSVVLDVTATESIQGSPGDILQIETAVVNNGAEDLAGSRVDFDVPDGVTITDLVGQEFVDGDERPAEGCVLANPQRVECHTSATLVAGATNEAIVEVKLNADAPAGELGVATLLVEGANGGSDSAETVITVQQEVGEVVLEARIDPERYFAKPGSVVSLATSATNVGTADMVGGIVDFEVPERASVIGIEGQDFVDGDERPSEGCALVNPQRVECHTAATLTPGDTAEATFLVQIPEEMSNVVLGDAVLYVAGDNGGSDTAKSFLEIGPHDGFRLTVTAPKSVEGAPGDVIEFFTTVANPGSEDILGGILDFEVPLGATVIGIQGQELVDGTDRPDEGCARVTPQRVECHTKATLPAYDGANTATFEVKIDDGIPAGQLGVATTHAEGDNGGDETVDTAETVITVSSDSGADGADDSGTETGDDTGAETGDKSGEDGLPDTGTEELPAALAAIGLLIIGGLAARALRPRRF